MVAITDNTREKTKGERGKAEEEDLACALAVANSGSRAQGRGTGRGPVGLRRQRLALGSKGGRIGAPICRAWALP
jgi:hypothetical protein